MAIQMKGQGDAPVGTPLTNHRSGQDKEGHRVLVCVGCRRPITSPAARIEKNGSHEHVFANPDGYRFRIGCFAKAVGLTYVGSPTRQWSWFPEYAWQIAMCGGCEVQLGWRYRGTRDMFHGLILTQLVEAEEEKT